MAGVVIGPSEEAIVLLSNGYNISMKLPSKHLCL